MPVADPQSLPLLQWRREMTAAVITAKLSSVLNTQILAYQPQSVTVVC